MVIKRGLLAAMLFVVAGASLAHQGVKNPAVKARMDAMVAIKAEMKIISDMAKGLTALDIQAAQSASQRIALLSSKTPTLFEAQATDPVSEALPSIWENFDDFVQQSSDMEEAARSAAQTIQDVASLRTSLIDLGKTCKACHSDYRK